MDKQQREYIHHLMLQYSDAMVRLTYRRVGDWHLAEDLVQETFLTACCKSERVCGHKKPVAWLFETLNNLTLRESRRFYHMMLQYSDAMVRLTYRRVGDWHLAEDLVQETFLTACCKSERVCGHKKPVAWLFETLNNLTLRESRRFYHTEVSIEDIAESYELTELPMACHIPMGLSGSEQEIILLRIDKGYSFLELAEHFGISEMACRQRLSRALHKCRTLLEEPLGSTPK